MPKTQDYLEEKEDWSTYTPEYNTMEDFEQGYADEIQKQEGMVESFDIDTWGTDIEGGKRSQSEALDVQKDLEYLKTDEGKKWWFQNEKKKQDEKIKEAAQFGEFKETEIDTKIGQEKELTADQLKIKELEALNAALIKDGSGEASTEINQDEIFKMLGGDRARGRDITSMLLGFAGAEGDTTMEKFQKFAKDEAVRPSEQQRLKEAAAMLEIKDKLAERQSGRDIGKLLAIEQAKVNIKLKHGDPSNMSWQNRKAYYADVLKTGSMKNTEVIRASIMAEPSEKGKRVIPTTENVAAKPEDFAVGLYIYDGGEKGKTVIEIIEENGIKKAIPRDEFVI